MTQVKKKARRVYAVEWKSERTGEWIPYVDTYTSTLTAVRAHLRSVGKQTKLTWDHRIGVYTWTGARAA